MKQSVITITIKTLSRSSMPLVSILTKNLLIKVNCFNDDISFLPI